MCHAQPLLQRHLSPLSSIRSIAELLLQQLQPLFVVAQRFSPFVQLGHVEVLVRPLLWSHQDTSSQDLVCTRTTARLSRLCTRYQILVSSYCASCNVDYARTYSIYCLHSQQHQGISSRKSNASTACLALVLNTSHHILVYTTAVGMS